MSCTSSLLLLYLLLAGRGSRGQCGPEETQRRRETDRESQLEETDSSLL